MGGAFALLMACMSCLRIQMPSDAIECYAFGAPPVLSLAEKSVARNVMEVREPGDVLKVVHLMWLNMSDDLHAASAFMSLPTAHAPHVCF